MTKLTYEERKELPEGEFVFPKTRRYRLRTPGTREMRWPGPAESRNTRRWWRRSNESIQRSM